MTGPAAAVAEEVAGEWLKELFGLPAQTSYAFVTGCRMAHVTCLAAARRRCSNSAGWDVERKGLVGAPPVRVFAENKRHVTMSQALRLLGLGRALVAVSADDQGRMPPEALAAALDGIAGPAIICAQVGEVNTGAIDAMQELATLAQTSRCWLHVDGAFGLWAAASQELRERVAGVEQADSWATDAHKWLNVPYDCGLAFVADADAHRAAMAMTASIWSQTPMPRETRWTGRRSSRDALRGIAVYTALRSLGREGRRGARRAQLPACSSLRRGLGSLGLRDPERCRPQPGAPGRTTTRRPAILESVQRSGEAWMSGTTWDRRFAIRISVSNWRTSDNDVSRTVAAFEHAAAGR